MNLFFKNFELFFKRIIFFRNVIYNRFEGLKVNCRGDIVVSGTDGRVTRLVRPEDEDLSLLQQPDQDRAQGVEDYMGTVNRGVTGEFSFLVERKLSFDRKFRFFEISIKTCSKSSKT